MEKRTCQGVYVCSKCGLVVRPKTQESSRKQQRESPCHECGATLDIYTCSGTALYQGVIARDGKNIRVWEHEGVHNHPRPGVGSRLSASERRAVDEQVELNPDASVHRLRTGTSRRDSVPLGVINPRLNDARASRYQVEQSRKRLNLAAPATSKGGLAFFHSINSINIDLGETFCIDSQYHTAPGYMSFQTDWMRTMLEGVVDNWKGRSEHVEGRQGMVTDANESFFRRVKSGESLLSTCVFSTTLRAWVPVLWTLMLGKDIAHHRPHFRHLFQLIVQKLLADGSRFEKDYLLTVCCTSRLCPLCC
jgi:GCM motif protein